LFFIFQCLCASLSNKTTNKIPIKRKNKVVHVSVVVKSGINKDTLPYMSSFFQGQTPKSDPAIKPTIIDIVMDL
jgi:hypothetical protein